MITKKVINTYKNGILTSSKELDVVPPVNPETDKPQRIPEHHRALDLSDASMVMLKKAFQAQEELAKEVRLLRRKLLTSQREVKARIREREALKKALISKQDKIASLNDYSDELQAKVSGLEDDNKFLEEELNKLTRVRLTSAASGAAALERDPLANHPLAQPTPRIHPGCAEAHPAVETRSIAANPVKR